MTCEIAKATAVIGAGDAFAPQAADILARLSEMTLDGEPVLSVYRSEQDGPWLLDVLFTQTPPDTRSRWLMAARDLIPQLPPFQFDPLAQRDWVAESQRALHPVRAGRFLVHGSHDGPRLLPSQWRIEIDAGRAFGTAHHASTKGCLLALEKLATAQALKSMHDVGTGTGVLAIAADRLGARPVSGGDIDPVAVRVAKENVRASRTRWPIAMKTAAGPYTRADVVVANILARPLIAMAPALSRAADKTLVLSGLRTRDRRRVEAAYRARGFVVWRRVVVEDWVTLILTRGGGSPSPIN